MTREKMECQRKGCKEKAEYWWVIYSHPEGEESYIVYICKKHLLDNFQMFSEGIKEKILSEYSLK